MTDKNLYLSKLQLREELKRCMNCKAQPCMNACPVNCNPREFIQFARDEAWSDAVATITRTNPMGQTCGLICPDKFCMNACTRNRIDFPIAIPRVQATILNSFRGDPCERATVASSGRRVAVIGAGPAGMAATQILINAGHHVVIYEARDEIGGALNMIPQERLPHEVIARDWAFIFDPELVTLHLGEHISEPAVLLTGDEPFDAVIVATGEPHCVSLGIPGEALSVSYMDYLYHPENYATRGHVAVIGGGNVAADCAVTAQRMGAISVEMFIRRRIADMRVSKPEFIDLLQHKINLTGMTSPVRIEQRGDKRCLYVRRNVFDGERWSALEDSTVALPYFDLVIRAIGSRADTNVDDDERLVYAGDCKTGGSTIVEAIASGQTSARAVVERLAALPRTISP